MAKNVADFSKEELKNFFNSFDNILCDCDGVIFLMGKVFEGVPESIKMLKSMGKKVHFITNNTSVPRSFQMDLLNKAGIEGTADDMINPTRAVTDYLKKIQFEKKIFLIGLPGMRKEIESAGFVIANEYKQEQIDITFESLIKHANDIDEDVGAVVVCFDFNMSYGHLNKAASYACKENVHVITTGNDRKLIVGKRKFCIGQGYFHDIVVDFSKRKPLQLGKPHEDFQIYLEDTLKYKPDRTLFVGDSLDQDILFASKMGYKTLLVLSGNTNLDELMKCDASMKPNYYLQQLGDVIKLAKSL